MPLNVINRLKRLQWGLDGSPIGAENGAQISEALLVIARARAAHP
jgi:hypothetical protein